MLQCFLGAMVSPADSGGDAFTSPALLLLLLRFALNHVFFPKKKPILA